MGSEEDLAQEMRDESQITGAFTLLALKTCGISGKFRATYFGQNYRDI